ncbi:MAG: rhomboid family intramembrane serine protease [Candidatus Micrarchaeota archaeon]
MVVIQLILFIVGVFFADLLSGGVLNGLFAMTPSHLLTEPWTIITSMFLHGNFLHLFFNMFGLFMFGPFLEAKVGGRNLLILFFACGILGNMGYAVTSGFGNVPVIGASGAIYGILGALAILQPNLMVFVGFIPMPIYIAAVFWFFAEFAYGITGVQQGIANFAHLFGLFGGLIAGKFFRKELVTKGSWLND